MKRIVLLVMALLFVLLPLASCATSTNSASVEAEGENVTLYFLNWGEYLEPSLIAEFETANPGIKVQQKLVQSNEEMYAICSTEGTQIDLLVPSDYLVQQLMAANLLAEINLENIPNFQYVEAAAKTRTFDAESKYSIPYMMGTVGIVYDTTKVDDVVDSWEILWDEKYAGQIVMYDSIRDSIMVALSLLGYDINTTDEAELAEAGELLIQQKQDGLVRNYGTDDIKDTMIGSGASLAVDYSGAAVVAIMENPDLNYIVPKEGSNVWVDNLVVLESSPNKEAAEKFINFLCDPAVAAKNAEYIGYTTPNAAAVDLLSEELLTNPAYLISDDVLARCEYYVDLGDDLEKYNDVWMKLKTAVK